MSLMLLLVTFITSDIPAIVLSPFNTMLISIASELRASSTSGFLYSVILYLPLSYTNITKYSPGFILSNSYFPLLSVVTFYHCLLHCLLLLHQFSYILTLLEYLIKVFRLHLSYHFVAVQPSCTSYFIRFCCWIIWIVVIASVVASIIFPCMCICIIFNCYINFI